MDDKRKKSRAGEPIAQSAARRKFTLKELLINCKSEQLHGETDFGPDVGHEVLHGSGRFFGIQ